MTSTVQDLVLREIQAEVERAMRKFPQWPTDPIHATAVIAEECGELQKATLEAVYEPHKGSRPNIRTEAVQTAAMCLRFIASLDEYEWFHSKQHPQNAPAEARVLPSPPAGCSAWIAVKDRFPDDMRDVLTFGRYGVHKACFEWGTEDDPCWWSDEVRKADFKESVTHWAELPNAPDQARLQPSPETGCWPIHSGGGK